MPNLEFLRNLDFVIIACLKHYGPSDIRSIQEALDLVGMVASLNDIETAAEKLVEAKRLKPATGFSMPAYKI